MIQLHSIEPRQILNNASDLEHNITIYLSETIENDEGPPPTPEGLARAVGFTSFSQLRSTLKTYHKDYKTATDFLVSACSIILDYYQQQGLTDRLSQQFIRFLSSAYFDISEKTMQETTITENKTITINISSSAPASFEEEVELIALDHEMKQLQSIERRNLNGDATRSKNAVQE